MASTDSTELTENFELLTDAWRRHVLYQLMAGPGTARVGDLAAAIAGRGGGLAGPAVNADVDAVETMLYHAHLPKLADAGIVAFDPETESVALREVDGLRQFLDDAAPIDGHSPTDAHD